MVSLEGRHCPMLFCDWCGGKLTEHGNCLWRATPEGGSAPVETITVRGGRHTAHVFFVHKDCDRAFCEANGGREEWANSEELPVFLVYLIDNSGIDWGRARAWAGLGEEA